MNKTKLTKFNLPDADIEIYDNFFDLEVAQQYYSYLLNNINWKQESMNLYGKEINYARLMAWYGQPGKEYHFSGKTQKPNDWTKEKTILDIKEELERLYNDSFNSVLLNKYRSTNDSISWHSDDEKELGDEPSIYSLSLGCEREFKLKHKNGKEFIDPYSEYSDCNSQGDLFNQKVDKEQKKIKLLKIRLKHNSLLIMRGKTQKYWLHSIDKIKSEKQLEQFRQDKYQPIRINLTFRNIIH